MALYDSGGLVAPWLILRSDVLSYKFKVDPIGMPLIRCRLSFNRFEWYLGHRVKKRLTVSGMLQCSHNRLEWSLQQLIVLSQDHWKRNPEIIQRRLRLARLIFALQFSQKQTLLCTILPHRPTEPKREIRTCRNSILVLWVNRTYREHQNFTSKIKCYLIKITFDPRIFSQSGRKSTPSQRWGEWKIQ